MNRSKKRCPALPVCSTWFFWAFSVVPLVFAAEVPPTGAEDEASRAYFAANGLLNRGLHDLAVVEYRKFLEAHPRHEKAPVARYGLAVSLFRLDRMDEAVPELEALRGVPKFAFAAEAATMLGQCRLARKNYAGAVESFDLVLREHADHALADDAAAGAIEAFYRLEKAAETSERCRTFVTRHNDSPLKDRVRFFWGLATMSQGEYAGAGDRFAEVRAASSDGPFAAQAGLFLGQCRFQQGQIDQAMEALTGVRTTDEHLLDDLAYWTAKCRLRQGDAVDAAKRLKAAIDKYPSSELVASMSYDRGLALLQSGDATAAAQVLGDFLNRFPKEEAYPDALHLLAVAEHQQRKYQESRTHCEDFLQRFGSHRSASAVRFLAAENRFLSEQWAEAVAGYRASLEDKPAEARALRAKLRMGLALHRLGRLDDAVDPLKVVVPAATQDAGFRPALFVLGDIYFQRSEWKTSEEYLAKYVSFENNMASADEAWLKIGLSRERQERYVEAIEAFDRVLGESSTDSHRLHARFEKGQCLVAAGKLEEAERIFRQVVTESSDKRFGAFAENHLGSMAMRRKAYKEAAEHFERALGQATGTPVEADILLGYGKAQSADGRYAAAEETFARFLEKHATDARVSEARAQRAIALSRLERFEEALSVIETSEPGFKALHPALVSTLQYEKAWCLRKLERPAAKDAYQSLIAENVEPSLRANALLELADIETSAKRYEIAKTHLVKLKELIQAPSSSVSPDVQEQALHRLGVCEFQLDRFKEAAEALEEFLEKFAQSSLVASASAFCGEAWVKAGRDDRAVTHLSHVVERFPSDPAHSAALLRLGEAQATLQRWTQSENALTQYLERYPQSESWYQAQFGIGWARENQGRHDDAISAYRLVVERHKGATAARAQFQIGECLFAKKQYQDAAAELLKVDILYAYPEWSAAALYEAGRCFDKLTKPAESQAQFRMVIEKFGQTRWAALAKEHLAETNGNGPGSR